MSKTYISKTLRDNALKRSGGRCSYCLSSQEITGLLLEIDHVVPEKFGGKTEENNLCMACRTCNDRKQARLHFTDPITDKVVGLFHPNNQKWQEHFSWSEDGTQIIALTAIGRVTVEALKLNRPEQVNARRKWVSVGWHPPKD